MIPPAPGSPNPFASFGERSMPFFAKRKRNVFKGPSLAFGGSNNSRSVSGSNQGSTPSHSRSASSDRMGGGRRSGEIAAVQEEDEEALEMADDMLEEDEDEDDRDTVKFRSLAEEDEDVEEVESFTPVVGGPGEEVEERIFEPGELEKAQNGAAKDVNSNKTAVGYGTVPVAGTATAVN